MKEDDIIKAQNHRIEVLEKRVNDLRLSRQILMCLLEKVELENKNLKLELFNHSTDEATKTKPTGSYKSDTKIVKLESRFS